MTKTSDDVRDSINKIFKAEVLKYASDDEFKIRRLPTGILTIDRILGGGVARGRFTEFYGNYSVGKTYTSLRTIATAQRSGVQCAYADAERSFDPRWANNLGVDTGTLAIFIPEDGEQLIDVVESILRGGEFGIVVVDSIAALIPKKEVEERADKEQMGLAGKLTSKMMRRLTAANKHNTAVILINQVREKIGVMWGKPETTTGGRAIPFYAGQRLEFRKGEKIKKEVDGKTQTVGFNVTIRVEKDKTGPNVERQGTVTFLGKQGIDKYEEIVTLAELDGILQHKGNSYSYNGDSATGREAFKRMLRKDRKLYKKIRKAVREGATSVGEEEG